METSNFIQTVEALHKEAHRRGLFFQSCERIEDGGRIVVLDGRPLIWFGSCSYLGLESHPDVISAAHSALDQYGTQFSSSRGYISSPAYQELEALLSQIFDAYVLVAPTTTLGHIAAFDVLATERDAVVLDHQVHNSVYRAAILARARGTTMELVRHENLEASLEVVARLSKKHRHVWFSTDGVYSMYGDLAPFELLQRLLDVAPNVKLYIDDAHGMSWAGRHGRGKFLSRIPLSPRVVVATSMAKAFGACGGILAFPTERERDLVRMCGGPMLFSGPVQPATLGAALAVARMHLSDDIVDLQRALQTRVQHMNTRLRDTGMPLLVENDTPIFFICLGSPETAFEVAQRLRADGMLVNVSIYPAVPMRRAGLRITLTTHLSLEDIDALVAGLCRHIPDVLASEGLSLAEIEALFHKTAVGAHHDQRKSSALSDLIDIETIAIAPNSAVEEASLDGLTLETFTDIGQVNKEEWDRMLGSSATCSWDSLKMQQACFRDRSQREHNWDFHYGIVRRPSGEAVCATFLTVVLSKDDMLMRHEVSLAIEARRHADPYFLTSLTVMMGSNFSEGDHLYVDRSGPWRAGLTRLLRWADEVREARGATQLIIRDLPGDDQEMDVFFISRGFIKTPMFDSHVLDVDWSSPDELIARGPNNRARRQLRMMRENAPLFTRRVYRGGAAQTLSGERRAHLHRLYHNVADKNHRINIFKLPSDIVEHILTSPAWEIITLELAEAAEPVVWFAAHRHADAYAAMVCGLDYDYIRSRSSYRQMLYQIAQRGQEVGAKLIRLGMTADIEKRRFNSRVQKNCIYAQSSDTYNGSIIREIVAELGLKG